jgi:hypothetical protein
LPIAGTHVQLLLPDIDLPGAPNYRARHPPQVPQRLQRPQEHAVEPLRHRGRLLDRLGVGDGLRPPPALFALA